MTPIFGSVASPGKGQTQKKKPTARVQMILATAVYSPDNSVMNLHAIPAATDEMRTDLGRILRDAYRRDAWYRLDAAYQPDAFVRATDIRAAQTGWWEQRPPDDFAWGRVAWDTLRRLDRIWRALQGAQLMPDDMRFVPLEISRMEFEALRRAFTAQGLDAQGFLLTEGAEPHFRGFPLRIRPDLRDPRR